MIGFKVSSSNYSFFKNADKFIILEIIFAEIRGFITLSAVKSLQFVSMWIRGHRFSHLKVLESYCKLLIRFPRRTKVRVIIFSNDSLQPYNLEQRSNPHSLNRAVELTGSSQSIAKVEMRMEALALSRGGWRLPGQQDGLNNLRFKCQTTRFIVSYVCLFDEAGKLLGSASSPIQIWKEGDCVELLWMKENLQESWSMAWRWMDISSG
ncbi:hypothetical protein HanOQP8_Chr03g0124801 [Helianthus annuus]|nr:hypothetical protein HanOQP8_Chr03g0124801 [Helianthus annuus]